MIKNSFFCTKFFAISKNINFIDNLFQQTKNKKLVFRIFKKLFFIFFFFIKDFSVIPLSSLSLQKTNNYSNGNLSVKTKDSKAAFFVFFTMLIQQSLYIFFLIKFLIEMLLSEQFRRICRNKIKNLFFQVTCNSNK